MEDRYTMWDAHIYAEIRDLVVCRLTRFNARRGGEPSRLSLEEWSYAINDEWLQTDRLAKMDEMEQALFKQIKVTFQTGKRDNHLVPVQIPTALVEAIKTLVNPEIRSFCTIHKANNYLFANTQLSETPVTG